MLARLNARAVQAGVSNLTSVLGNASQSQFPPESFDVIFLVTVLGEIPDREDTLRQCHSTLKPSGLLSVTEIFPDPHYQSRTTVRRLAEAVGFRLKKMHGPLYFFTANFLKYSH
jgi:ubiquinone/menaquinone biosynthesis C-methylase UbiE